MQGPAVPLPIPGAYHIDWYIEIGPPLHYIFTNSPSVLYLMVALEGCYMDQDHVPNPQGCHLALPIVI